MQQQIRPYPRHLRLMAGLLAGTLLMSGCAGVQGGGYSGPLTPQQQALRQQAEAWNQTVATGVVSGALLGAAGGAIIAAATHGNAGRGALIGGGLGALGGGLLGTQVANNNQQQAQAAQTAQQRLASAQQSAQRLGQMADAAEQTTADNRAKLAQLDSQYRSGQITAAQYRAQTASMRDDIRVMRNAAAGAAKAQQDLVQVAANTPGVAAQERKVGEDQSRITNTADQMERDLARIPAG